MAAYQCRAMQNFPCCIRTPSPYFRLGRLITNTSINLRYSSGSQVPIIVHPHMQILSLHQGWSFLESGNNIRLNSIAHKFIINARPFSTKKINKFKVKANGSSDHAALGGNTALKMQHKAKVISAEYFSVTGKLNHTAACSNPDKSTTGSAQGDDNKNSEGSVINLASKDTKCGQAAASKASVKKKHKSKSMNQDDIVTNKETSKSNSSAHKTKLPVKKNQNPASKKKVKELSKSSAVLEIPADTSNLTKVNDVHSSSESTKNMVFKPLYPPSGKSVVVVESATKAKVIQNYLGNMYEVLPSNGHLRDLAGKSGSVRPDDDFSMVWEVHARSLTHLKSIKDALKGAENLILASDPDREGEAIAWHIIDMLQQQDALSKRITVARVVFHEITESSIKSALQAPREIDRNLVDAYLARRALDYLIGFNISPLLWRKLPGCSSAGRVQSAALALICDREMEIEQFEKKEYWTVGVQFNNTTFKRVGEKCSISSHLTHINSQKMDQLSIRSDDEAREIEKMITSSKFKVVATKTSKIVKNPPMPYITSTLQQDAANKLHFTASYTMKLAQKLYEGIRLPDGEAVGLITYMRTDGLHVSTEAAEEINSFVKERYGEKFASKIVRKHFKKVKNAQEAHEAIRPTYIRRLPEALADIVDDDSLKLYTLIWTRTMACQMESATTDMVQVDIENMEGNITFRSVASKLRFPGFQEVYKDRKVDLMGSEDKEHEVGEIAFTDLHNLKVSDSLSLENVCLQQHHTKPPPRYSEGALVKKMEELGIGRPSTYASTMKVLQDRNYVTVKSRALHPEFRGRMLSAFLSHHFSEVADYSFTADMENELDNVSAGETDWKGLIKDYWLRFSKSCGLVSNTEVRQVEGMLEKTFEHYLFSQVDNDTRVCPSCSIGTLRFKVSKFGSGYFIGCDGYPKCKYIAMNIHSDKVEYVSSDKPSFPPKFLGDSPNSNEKIFLKKGPYGYYVQLGEDRKGYKPERASIGEDADPENVTLEIGLKLLSSKKVKKSGRSRSKPKTEKVLQ